MHDRIAINHLCFLSDTMPKFAGHLHALGAKRVSLLAGYMLRHGGHGSAGGCPRCVRFGAHRQLSYRGDPMRSRLLGRWR